MLAIEQNTRERSLEESFEEVYTKFKLHFYSRIFQRFETREASLTAVETFCIEAIHALGTPTISEFADFVDISPANAAYKVQSLEKKGYLTKVRSDEDRRESLLVVTDRFHDYYNLSYSYVTEVVSRIQSQLPASDVAAFKQMLNIIADELMPEVTSGKIRYTA